MNTHPPFILFCSDPSEPRRVDPAYADERVAVEEVGALWSLFSFEDLVEGQPDEALRRFEGRAPLALYRGWMLRPEAYTALSEALARRGVRLANSPEQYRHCHHFPESYGAIEPLTPRSVWLPPGQFDAEAVMRALESFGDRPLILKDYVKSRKHEWIEACFIPSASDRDDVMKVVSRFVELQGEDLAGGLVFREFVEFAPLAQHSKSGMPLTKEFRLFFLDGALLASAPYWEEGHYDASLPDIAPFLDAAGKVRSRFFSMDVAERRAGGWMIVELGDGQVAGLPERLARAEFYRSLVRQWPEQ